MFFDYKCESCNKTIELQLSPNGHIPERIKCKCGGNSRRVYGGHQISMDTWRTKIREYNDLPEHAKEKNGIIKKHI